MPNGFTHDVFLSHRAKDKAVVRPLAERLVAVRKHLKVGFDERVLKPGDSIPAKIEAGPSHFGFRISDLRSPACRPMRSARTGGSWPVRP